MNQKEPVTQLSRKQAAFVEALLTGASLTDAAKTARVSYATAKRWQHLPIIEEALSAGLEALFEAGIEKLKGLMPKALDTLEKHLNAPVMVTAGTQLGAARALIEQALLSHKVDEVRAELAQLRRRLDDAGK